MKAKELKELLDKCEDKLMGCKTREEFYCHDCGGYVTVDLDMSLNGNHVVTCPKCKHEHCRVIKDGKITDDRWDARNGPASTQQYTPTMARYSATSTADSTSSGDYYCASAWASLGTGRF